MLVSVIYIWFYIDVENIKDPLYDDIGEFTLV